MTDASSPRGDDVPVPARVAASADAWKRKLLDLTKRNRALHFRPTKVSTIALVDEQPAEVFRLLYLRERSMRFKAAPEIEGGAERSTAVSPSPPRVELAGDDEEDDSPQVAFVPYDPSALGEGHTDDWLQTASTPEALDKSLRRLDEQATASIEEQGVNTLFLALGMLHYLEVPPSEQVFRAPLVLLPVTLSRKSARAGYVVRAGDDDPLVNPALVESLRRDLGIVLPELPAADSIADDYDLRELFGKVSAAVATFAGWSVKTSVYLGLFSFQKLVMYKDLEKNAAALTAHRLIRQLVERKGDERSGAAVGLPEEIRALDLDRDYPPERTYQVVDADSSQLRAVAAVARGHDLVIEGPPGTGKSQTITNLIAQALAAGKSVLFVAEKMAALSVVHDRLMKAGLGEFCLELHSTKANKRAVMQELAASLDASLRRVEPPTTSTERLPAVRATLAEYIEAVHRPHGALGVSPWTAYGELGRVLDAPRVTYAGPAEEGVTRERLDQTLRDLGDLAVAASEIGVPARHPWRDTTRTFYSAGDLGLVEQKCRHALPLLADVMRRAAAVETALRFPPIRTFGDIDTAVAISDVLAQSPGAPPHVLESSAWNAPPAEATGLIARGRALAELEARIRTSLMDDVFDQDHAQDIAYVERRASGVFGFLAFLDGRFRAIRRRWIGYRRPAWSPSLFEQADLMRQVDRTRAERSQFDAMMSEGRELFGRLWQEADSDWASLDRYVAWVVAFRQLCVRHHLSQQAVSSMATWNASDVSSVAALGRAAADARNRFGLGQLGVLVGWPPELVAAEPFEALSDRVCGLVENLALAPRWAAFESACRAAEASLAKEVLPAAMDGTLPFDGLAAAFLRAFWLTWLSAVVRARPELERFHTLAHEQRVEEFRRLDRLVLVENRSRLVGELRDRVQHRLREPDVAEALPHLRREMARQRGLSPLRRTMQLSEAAVRAIKPCFLMSPLTVAQLLEGAKPTFDLVIFDEASQLPPEDAVGAVLRTRQLVVVGDPKQLPPTNFFAISSGTVDSPVGEDGAPLYEDAESILEHFMGAGFPTNRLKWHYRSAHESLISFSNVQFYDSDLLTFPSVERGTDTKGLQFEFVRDGLYEGKGLNAAEARCVADAVVRFAREELVRRAAGDKPLSLGVGTFNLRQQIAIQDELETRRRDDASIDPFFDRAATEPFFVKNLENIQGDERDVIFLSVTYARGIDGKLRYQFGPLNGENGWRRLNVLTTRARQRMRVFSSIRGDDIGVTDTSARGAHLLREFLLYAEGRGLQSSAATSAANTDSPFERDVLRELQDKGLRVVPQVGDAGYRIDLGVVDDEVPGRFVCGIECDGVAYHASATTRDRDRLRQQVLEARGWTIHRVWSTDWFKDRQGQIERLLRLVEESRRRARDEHDAALQVRERSAHEAEVRRVEETERARLEAAEIASRPDTPYERPAAQPYVFAAGAGQYEGDLQAAPISRLVKAIVAVVDVEAPIHLADLAARVAAMWSSRAGSRIQARILEACGAAERDLLVERRGEFLWKTGGGCVPRCRLGTRIPADRIAREEYEQAILDVLRGGHGFARVQLVNEVRAVFGFGRTGAALDGAIGAAIDELLASGRLGEASTGIRLRR